MRDYIAIANKYIDDVINGEVLACSYVKQACERQYKDLRQGDFSYTFNDERASHICKFIELLPHIKGKWARQGLLLKLEPWQIFILTTVFGWVDDQGFRRFKIGYVEVPRKNGKSALSSGVALYMLAADGEIGAEVYSAATTMDQAKIVWIVAKHMVNKSRGIKARFDVKTSSHSIFIDHDASIFKALARDSGGNHDGLNIHCSVIDELHAHKTREIFDVIETGTGAREQPLVWVITTAGSNRAGICYEQRDYVTRILKGSEVDERYFGIIYTIDDGDEWTDPASWEKANPNWGVSVNPEDIASKAHKAQALPSALNNFLTKHLDVWVNAAVAWMNMRKWDSCAKSLNMDDFIGCPCYLGLDLAEKRDIAALSILFKRDGLVYSFGKYYLNEYQVEVSGNSQYSGWHRSGHLIVNDGDVTDFDLIGDEIKALCKVHDVKEVAFDPAFSQYFATKLVADGIPMVSITQTSKFFTTPFIELENLVYSNQFIFDGNPALTWMVSNVMAKTSIFSGLMHPIKESEGNKIDGLIALLMSLGRMQLGEGIQPSIYEKRGIVAF